MLDMFLYINCDAKHDDADAESRQGATRKPSPFLTKGKAQCQGTQPDCQQTCASGIKSSAACLCWTWHAIEQKGREEYYDADRNIDIKYPAPAQVLRNNAANCGPGGDSQ